MFHDLLVTAILFLVLDQQHREKHHFHYVRYPYSDHLKISKTQLPDIPQNHTRIVVVSDTHDRHHGLGQLPPCDVFVHCGDVLMTGRFFSQRSALKKLTQFNQWLGTVPAKERIVIAGNHDKQISILGLKNTQRVLTNCTYLENTSTHFGPWSIWGTPLSKGKSPNRAFQNREFHTETLEKVPEEVDILITHGPLPEVESKVRHKLHLCGHNHNSYGIRHKEFQEDNGEIRKVLSVCAPVHDGQFRLRHLPVIIDIPIRSQLSTEEEVKNHQEDYQHFLEQYRENDDKYMHNEKFTSSHHSGMALWFRTFKLKSNKIQPTDKS